LKSRQETITRPPLEVLSTAKQIAMSRGWRVHGATATKLEIKTGISVKSWGETIRVTALYNPSSPGYSIVTVGSSARHQAYDWGKSGDNVEYMMTGLMAIPGYVPPTGSSPPPAQPPFQVPVSSDRKFCANCGRSMPKTARFCPGCGESADYSSFAGLDSKKKRTASVHETEVDLAGLAETFSCLAG